MMPTLLPPEPIERPEDPDDEPEPFEPQPAMPDDYSHLFAHVVVWGLIILLAALYGIAAVWGPR